MRQNFQWQPLTINSVFTQHKEQNESKIIRIIRVYKFSNKNYKISSEKKSTMK
jgi:hypothetical protein